MENRLVELLVVVRLMVYLLVVLENLNLHAAHHVQDLVILIKFLVALQVIAEVRVDLSLACQLLVLFLAGNLIHAGNLVGHPIHADNLVHHLFAGHHCVGNLVGRLAGNLVGLLAGCFAGCLVGNPVGHLVERQHAVRFHVGLFHQSVDILVKILRYFVMHQLYQCLAILIQLGIQLSQSRIKGE